MLEVLFDWSELVKLGGDVATYFVMAMLGTGIFLLRLVMSLFGGDTGDLDVDHDFATDASFTLFSLLSVMAFIMGTGWMGLACRIDWSISRGPSALIAVGSGVGMMLLAAGSMSMMRRLNHDAGYDTATAVGNTARVYMKIPAKGGGLGKIQVTVSGRLKTMTAASRGGELAAFSDVRVVEVRDDDVMIVEPLG